ncbi:unnamed protein product [Pedinophyceae sp. YPF-701]|nr:unnamed protein product [Pedinophyceae sp. YPF-701]
MLAHEPGYARRFITGTLTDAEVRRIGFGDVARTDVLIRRTLWEVAGTLLTARRALTYGMATNTAGGTHHALPDAGSGFCLINDMAITARTLLREGAVARVLVLDLDVHQGDGTAAIFEGDDSVATVSFHAASNFPARKQKSDIDVALPDNADDRTYLGELARVLPTALEHYQPDLVLYDAGVDLHQDDRLGRLSVSCEGISRRDAMVFDECAARGVPCAGLVGGGYHPDLSVLAERHARMHEAAAEVWQGCGFGAPLDSAPEACVAALPAPGEGMEAAFAEAGVVWARRDQEGAAA